MNYRGVESTSDPCWDFINCGKRDMHSLCGNNQPFGRRVPAALGYETGNYVVCPRLMQYQQV